MRTYIITLLVALMTTDSASAGSVTPDLIWSTVSIQSKKTGSAIEVTTAQNMLFG